MPLLLRRLVLPLAVFTGLSCAWAQDDSLAAFHAYPLRASRVALQDIESAFWNTRFQALSTTDKAAHKEALEDYAKWHHQLAA